MDLIAFNKSSYKGKIKETVKFMESARLHKDAPIDLCLSDIITQRFTTSVDEFYRDLGIDPGYDTISNLFTLPDEDVRWLVPEIIRDSLRLGLRTGPIYPNLIIREEQTSGLTQMMPWLNMSDAAPRRVGEAETIPLGSLSYGSKTFSIFKVGRGISLSYEVTQYSSLNVVSLFLQDFGIKLGHALDTLAIDCLINGEQNDGSESAPVIGIGNLTTGKAYRDFLKIWIRMSRLGRNPNTIIGGENAALDTLDLPEFKEPKSGTPVAQLNVKTPIPTSSNYFIHGSIDDNQEIILDPTAAMLKFNAQPLVVESEKIVSNQTNAFYASLTTGFARVFRDACVIMDSSLPFDENGFPTWMDLDSLLSVNIE
jgi:hypothetical protein